MSDDPYPYKTMDEHALIGRATNLLGKAQLVIVGAKKILDLDPPDEKEQHRKKLEEMGAIIGDILTLFNSMIRIRKANGNDMQRLPVD